MYTGPEVIPTPELPSERAWSVQDMGGNSVQMPRAVQVQAEVPKQVFMEAPTKQSNIFSAYQANAKMEGLQFGKLEGKQSYGASLQFGNANTYQTAVKTDKAQENAYQAAYKSGNVFQTAYQTNAKAENTYQTAFKADAAFQPVFQPMATSEKAYQSVFQPQAQSERTLTAVGEIMPVFQPSVFVPNANFPYQPPTKPKINGGDLGGFTPDMSGTSGFGQKYKQPKGKYQPSFIALTLGITASKGKAMKTEKYGFEIRPIIQGKKEKTNHLAIGDLRNMKAITGKKRK